MGKKELSKFLELLKNPTAIAAKTHKSKGFDVVTIAALPGHISIVATSIDDYDLSLGWIGRDETVVPIGNTKRADFIDFLQSNRLIYRKRIY